MMDVTAEKVVRALEKRPDLLSDVTRLLLQRVKGKIVSVDIPRINMAHHERLFLAIAKVQGPTDVSIHVVLENSQSDLVLFVDGKPTKINEVGSARLNWSLSCYVSQGEHEIEVVSTGGSGFVGPGVVSFWTHMKMDSTQEALALLDEFDKYQAGNIEYLNSPFAHKVETILVRHGMREPRCDCANPPPTPDAEGVWGVSMSCPVHNRM